mmetsp:Transcript_49317/g.67226  ORF Transcript_49317/g.67226 Transcript_49317/m.67226 type:complete len:93 (+) Transcript_49317:397-675(+)
MYPFFYLVVVALLDVILQITTMDDELFRPIILQCFSPHFETALIKSFHSPTQCPNAAAACPYFVLLGLLMVRVRLIFPMTAQSTGEALLGHG